MGGDAGHRGEDEGEDEALVKIECTCNSARKRSLLLIYLIICVLVRPIDATINHCHTKFLILRKTQLRVCVVSLHYGRVGRMRARKKMKLWYCLFRLLDPQKPVTGCGEAGKTVNLRESPPSPFCSSQ